jgi:hypothetical protein
MVGYSHNYFASFVLMVLFCITVFFELIFLSLSFIFAQFKSSSMLTYVFNNARDLLKLFKSLSFKYL